MHSGCAGMLCSLEATKVSMMAEEVGIVDINIATVKDLETLFGVGRAKAEAIHTARMVKGAFSSLEELLSIPGIGRNVLDQNKEVLVCNALPEPHGDDPPDLPLEDDAIIREAGVSRSNTPLDLCTASPAGSLGLSPASGKGGSHSRRSSRRSSQQQEAQAASSSSSSNTGCGSHSSRTTPIASKYLTASSSSSASRVAPSRSGGSSNPLHLGAASSHPNISSALARTRQRLDSDSSGPVLGANNRSHNHSSHSNDDSAMDWHYNREPPQNDHLDNNRINTEQSANSSLDSIDKFNNSSLNISSCSYLIAGELGEAELNKLRVRENNYGDDLDNNGDLDYKEDECSDRDDSMQETALSRSARIMTSGVGPTVPGSDTPYEEPPEVPLPSLGSSELDLERLRALYATPAAPSDTVRYGGFSGDPDGSYNVSGTQRCLGMVYHSGCKPLRRRKTSEEVDQQAFSGPSSDHAAYALMDQASLGRNSRSDDAHNSDDDDQEEDSDEELEDGDVDEQMVVDTTVAHTDKKQGKRKYEVGGELRTLLPVKKSCKAEKPSVAGGGIVRRLSPAPAGMPSWLTQFSEWKPQEKLTALDSLITICQLNEVRHLHHMILPLFQRDFISLLPKELSLYVLSFLSPKDLLNASQACRYWNILTADNLLWREKCKEAGIENFVEHMDKRRKKGTSVSSQSPYKEMFLRRHSIECNWRINPLKPFRTLKGHDDHVITCLQFSGNTIVSGSDDNTLKVWNATTSKCVRTLTGHTGGVWSSQMRDNIIVSGSTDRMLRVWDAETGQCTQTLYGHTSTVRCLHLHNNTVVSGSRDATLRVWDVTTGHCHHVLVGHVAAVRCVQYNGRLVVSGAYDFMVKVWNPESEECLHTLQGHTNRVYSLQFDGVHVVSGSLDTTIRVWDVESGTCRHTLMGHQSLTSGMELHNNILISGNADSTVKVWDIVTGQCLQTLSGSNKHRSAVTCLQFINKFVVTSSDDGTVKLWDVSTGEFVRNLVTLDTGNSGGVVWRIRASDTKLVCAVGSRNGTEETKLLVLDFDVEEES